MTKKRDWKQITLLGASFLLLMTSYVTNFAKITFDDYVKFDRPDELNIIGRLNLSNSEGMFSMGGFTGATDYYATPQDSLLYAENYNARVGLQFDYYLKGIAIPSKYYTPYKTQTGGQAMLYGVLQKISPLSPGHNYTLFRIINATLIALCFLLFIGWAYRNYGLVAGIVTSVFIFITPFFTTLSLSLWWCLWSYYIPFLAMLLVLERRNRYKQKLWDKRVFLYLFIAVFAKCFLTGFEFISTTLVATICPIIYYCILEKQTFKNSFILLLKATFTALLAVICETMVLIWQTKCLMGSFADGINHIWMSFIKRSTFKEGEIVLNTGEVLKMYTFDFAPFGWNGESFSIFSFGLFATITAVIAFACYRFRKGSMVTHMKTKALIGVTAFSLLAPLSWLVIFKQHAALHFFIDPIVWYIPTILFVYVIIGVGISRLLQTPEKQ